MEKLKLKKSKSNSKEKSKSSSSGLFKKKKADGIAPLENPEDDTFGVQTSNSSGQPPAQGSVISIQQADARDTSNNTDKNGKPTSGRAKRIINIENEPASVGDVAPPNSRPTSARPTSARPTSARPTSARVPDSSTSSASKPPKAEERGEKAAEENVAENKKRSGKVAPSTSKPTERSNERESDEGSPVLRPPAAVADKTNSSQASLLSKEAWMAAELQPDASTTEAAAPPVRSGSVVSVRENPANSPQPATVKEERPVSKWFPADMNEAHAYVPYLYCRGLIAKMMEDMKGMKKRHYTIVTDIENNYKSIEDKTQNQFNSFVISLRSGYGNKVKTFRQVIEVHRLELAQKQQYWDDALASLSERNKKLLEDKKKLLINNKLEIDRLEKEKAELQKGLTTKLDEASKRIDDNSRDLIQRLEEKEAELQAAAASLLQERAEKEQLKRQLDDLRSSSSRHQLPAAGDNSLHTAERPSKQQTAQN